MEITNLQLQHYSGRRMGRRDSPDVTLFVNALAVFVVRQIRVQVDGLAAQLAAYFWDRVTTHECLLWTVTN
jgi:hypothetical protein